MIKYCVYAIFKMKVVGLCGREGSGKTFVANLLTSGNSRFDIVEIVDPIQYIVNILFGFSNTDNSQFKLTISNLLTKNNITIKPKRTYRAAFRKKTTNNEWIEMSFADALKQIASVIYDIDFNILLAQNSEDRKKREQIPDIRTKLEFLGTDVFRNQLDPEIWIKIVEREIKNYDKIVISDVRFSNEMDFIQRMNGSLLLIYREPKDLLITSEDRKTHPAKWSFLESCGNYDNLIMFHNSF